MTLHAHTAAPLVEELARQLDEAGVLYCHWKSNADLARAQRAETDLDLLVARHQVAAFVEVVSRCGFVAAARPDVKPLPGVTHYFAYDHATDRFVHVHAHHRLVVGHDRTKNYHLPIEEPFLASVSDGNLLPTPAVEFEYVVFVIRMVLKYAIADEMLWAAMGGGRAGLKPSERMELAHLQTHVSKQRVEHILAQHLHFIGGDLFAAAEAVVEGRASSSAAVATARRVQSRMAPHARHGRRADAVLRMTRRAAVSARRRTGRRRGFRLAGGGAIIAVLGADGSGKSTAVWEVRTWLDEHFDVATIHLGKPPWSWTTYLIRGGMKAARVADATTDGVDTRALVWHACKARDRYLAYRSASRAANRGRIVISDRYPHPALQMTDIPQIARLTEGRQRSSAEELLVKIEERYSRRVAMPDVAIVLKVEPREAARRKVEERYEYVLERATEIWGIDWAEAGVHVIDASQPADAVAAELKSFLWDALS